MVRVKNQSKIELLRFVHYAILTVKKKEKEKKKRESDDDDVVLDDVCAAAACSRAVSVCVCSLASPRSRWLHQRSDGRESHIGLRFASV